MNPLFLDSAPNNLRSHSPILDIWHALKNDEDFRVDFADRVARHCLGVGELSDAKLLARFRRLENQLDKAIIAESCRWGDSAWGREDNPHTREKDYRVNCQKVAKLIEGNSARFVSALRDEGYYPDIKPPVLATPIPMGAVPLGINMRWKVPKNSSEQVYYTLDGSDPRLAGGHRNPEAKQWLADAAAIEITAATQVTARAFTQGKWSPRFRRTFFVEPQGFPLRITELMYHPSPDKSDESLEFVELQNISNVSIQLGGFHFTGIEYLFPPDAKLMPKQVVVLIPNDDPERFRDQYPGVQVLGLYRKNLSNGGERIAIQDANEQVISELTYQTSGDWPNSAGGTGMSIHLLDTLGDQSDPRNWRAGDSSPGKQG